MSSNNKKNKKLTIPKNWNMKRNNDGDIYFETGTGNNTIKQWNYPNVGNNTKNARNIRNNKWQTTVNNKGARMYTNTNGWSSYNRPKNNGTRRQLHKWNPVSGKVNSKGPVATATAAVGNSGKPHPKYKGWMTGINFNGIPYYWKDNEIVTTYIEPTANANAAPEAAPETVPEVAPETVPEVAPETVPDSRPISRQPSRRPPSVPSANTQPAPAGNNNPLPGGWTKDNKALHRYTSEFMSSNERPTQNAPTNRSAAVRFINTSTTPESYYLKSGGYRRRSKTNRRRKNRKSIRKTRKYNRRR